MDISLYGSEIIYPTLLTQCILRETKHYKPITTPLSIASKKNAGLFIAFTKVLALRSLGAIGTGNTAFTRPQKT
jgi:hypothetical protein